MGFLVWGVYVFGGVEKREIHVVDVTEHLEWQHRALSHCHSCSCCCELALDVSDRDHPICSRSDLLLDVPRVSQKKRESIKTVTALNSQRSNWRVKQTLCRYNATRYQERHGAVIKCNSTSKSNAVVLESRINEAYHIHDQQVE